MDKVCRCLIGFEDGAAIVYLNLARRFSKNKDLSWFWLKMSMEEKQHALLLEFCGCEGLLGTNMPDRLTIQRLTTLFQKAQKKAGGKDITVDDAFLLAAELEGSEINAIYARLIGPVRGTPYILRKKIETLGSDHLQAIIRGARQFRVSPSTMDRLLELKRKTLKKAS
jgi:hypothetical protein